MIFKPTSLSAIMYPKRIGTSHVIEYQLRRKSSAPLNDTVEALVDSFGGSLKQLPKFELIEGASSLMGSGEGVFVEIIIRYEGPTIDDIPSIERILEIAEATADDLEVHTKEINERLRRH